jgi:hypothetical protein
VTVNQAVETSIAVEGRAAWTEDIMKRAISMEAPERRRLMCDVENPGDAGILAEGVVHLPIKHLHFSALSALLT